MERRGREGAVNFQAQYSQSVPSAVLDFRRQSNVPDYSAAKQPRRVLVLLVLAAAVVVLVIQAGHFGTWFAEMGRAGDGGSEPTRGAPTASTADVDVDRSDRVPTDRNALFPGVRRDYLSDVRDDEVFRPAESNAWFHLLAILEKTSQRDLNAASLGSVGFRQLDRQADAYRGRLVTVHGIVRAAKLVSAPENAFGINRYYQLWLQPERNWPELVVVYALKLPEGFPLGDGLDATSTATGFFFKRWAYQAQEGVTTAPLILARTIEWQPAPPPPPEAPLAEQIVRAVVVALILAVLIVGYLVSRTRGASRHRHLSREVEPVQPVLASQELVDQADRDEGAADAV